jgi:hypothetical protein
MTGMDSKEAITDVLQLVDHHMRFNNVSFVSLLLPLIVAPLSRKTMKIGLVACKHDAMLL